jgi:hypothetical protein
VSISITHPKMSNQTNNKSSGNQAKASAFDPRAPLLVQPFKRLVEEGFISRMTTVWTPTGVETKVQIDERVAAADTTFKVGVDYPAARIARLAEEKDLVPKKGKKVASQKPVSLLPKKSLCEEDFVGSGSNLASRAKDVASAIGGPALAGRIMSLKDIRTPEGVLTFQDWWKLSSPAERYILLTDGVRRAKLDKNSSVLPALAALSCPFLDSLEFGKEKSEEEGAEAGPSTQVEVPAPAPSQKKGKSKQKPAQ